MSRFDRWLCQGRGFWAAGIGILSAPFVTALILAACTPSDRAAEPTWYPPPPARISE